MSSITKVLIGALATLSAVSALPQQNYQPNQPTTLTTAVTPAPTTNNDGLIAELRVKSTAIKRFQKLLTNNGEKLLSEDEIKKQTVFDFNNAQPAPNAKGGATKAANIDTFPILTDLGISTTLGFLNPCGMNTPHVHPRATEFLTVVEGSVKFGYILENGLTKAPNPSEISGTLEKFQGTVFPMGSIHYQFNPECKPAVFVAALNSDDPGTSQVAQNFFGLNPDVVNATLGFPKQLDGKNIEEFRKFIPANIAHAIDSCLATCPEAKEAQQSGIKQN
jgi:oxalate decarboxylase/phosphoglucose isomerase-like protein (cupin superfamily)